MLSYSEQEHLQNIAVVSDIHGNSCALKSFINEIRNRDTQYIIILGDLLTYGCDPNRVVELLNELQQERHCLFIKGNHDQFYFDLSAGLNPFGYEVPDFVKESVNWTHGKLEYNLKNEFDWVNKTSVQRCYFAHANPYEYGDWRYINSEADHLEAADTLSQLGFNIAFFGHTHRNKVGVCSVNSSLKHNRIALADKHTTNFSLEIDNAENVSIFNSGSIGQSRGTPPSFLHINILGQHVNVDIVNLDFDISTHIQQIQQSGMSLSTIDKLSSYFIKRVQ